MAYPMSQFLITDWPSR